jgi:hypothetical protein
MLDDDIAIEDHLVIARNTVVQVDLKSARQASHRREKVFRKAMNFMYKCARGVTRCNLPQRSAWNKRSYQSTKERLHLRR